MPRTQNSINNENNKGFRGLVEKMKPYLCTEFILYFTIRERREFLSKVKVHLAPTTFTVRNVVQRCNVAK